MLLQTPLLRLSFVFRSQLSIDRNLRWGCRWRHRVSVGVLLGVQLGVSVGSTAGRSKLCVKWGLPLLGNAVESALVSHMVEQLVLFVTQPYVAQAVIPLHR